MIKKFTPPEAESLARKYGELLRQGKLDQVNRDLDSSVKDSEITEALGRMASMFPADPPESVKVVGVTRVRKGSLSGTGIALEYQFPNKWLWVYVVTRTTEYGSTILGLNVAVLPDSLENQNRFSLAGKSTDEYLLLVAAAASILFSIYVLILCFRNNNQDRKWLWMLFILVGFGKLAVNWTTGQWSVSLLAFQIPCAMASAAFFGPWTVSVAAPIGAVLYLFRYVSMKKSNELPPP